jgi:hypothetical protein
MGGAEHRHLFIVSTLLLLDVAGGAVPGEECKCRICRPIKQELQERVFFADTRCTAMAITPLWIGERSEVGSDVHDGE